MIGLKHEMLEKTAEYVKVHQKKKQWRRVVICLAAVVVFCTVYALILPAITMGNGVYCGQTEHQHGEDCFTRELICPLEEKEGHVHGEDCYGEETLACQREESERHTHTDDCYEITCQPEDPENHIHDESCYELICGQEESEGHIHSEECYERPLVCEQEESEGHQHTDGCYESVQSCELPEHIHVLACYSNPEADVETSADWEETLPEKLTGIWADDLLAVAKSQLDYTESTDNYEAVEEETTKGYTRYGAWYGMPYEDWCAMFVSFCLNYADIPGDTVPREWDVRRWVDKLSGKAEGYESYDLYRDAKDYMPVSGDLIFFDADEDGIIDHMGIVEEYQETGAILTTIEGDSENRVQSVIYDLEDEADAGTIMGYASLPAEPEHEKEETPTEEGKQETEEKEQTEERKQAGETPKTEAGTQTYDGGDYTVTVTYGIEAQIPKEAELTADEYDKTSEIYQTRYEEASAFYGWEEDTPDRIRLFHVGFYLEGREVEPAAPVEITIAYTDKEGCARCAVTHFGKETETVSASSSYADGKRSVEFTLDSFSDIMLLAEDTVSLDGKSFVLVNDSKKAAMLAEQMSGSPRKLAGRTVALKQLDDSFYMRAETEEEKAAITLWTFEAAEGGYYIKADVDGGAKYLTINGQNITLEDEPTEGSVITVTEGTIDEEGSDWTGMVKLNAGGYAVNLYGGDVASGFGGWTSDNSANEWFRLISEVKLLSEDVVPGISPSGTVINLFDYWMTDKNEAQNNNYNSGINKDHVLKFFKEGNGNNGTVNKWTGAGDGNRGVLQGIVAKELINGYPALSGNTAILDGNDSTESLGYLFSPEQPSEYKSVYRNVSGLLQEDKEGYYYYDSTKNYAEFHEDANGFTLYNDWAVQYDNGNKGEFFPFNAYQTVHQDTNADSSSLNHHFGMTLTTRFVQQYGGHTDSTRKNSMTFEFSGDDDVWIFIDNVLVADLGGIHDAASVDIDFVQGTVLISKVYGEGSNITTNFAEIFKDTGVKLDDDGKTLADNSYHTLKFFYLERGGYASNLKLKYNLTSYPPTGVNKVNQYGYPVSGASFAVYKADADYNITDNNPVYTGKTDGSGQMIFKDQDDMPYTLEELEQMFGEHFVLKESFVPPGYRMVGNDIYLRITNNVLVCENTKDSGVWTSPNLQISAPNTILLYKEYNGSKLVEVMDDHQQEHGKIFAVLLKYIGERDGDDNATELEKETSWAPVYGDNENGFTVVDVNNFHSENPFVSAVIDTAARYTESNNVFSLSASGAIQGGLTGMPGDITTYYYMLPEGEKGKTRYTVAYYWTSESSLEKANAANTYRIDADGTDLSSKAHKFDRVFGASIEVPNLLNRLIVQKLDEEGGLVNGAVFAMYKVEETESGIYYAADNGTLIDLDKDADGDNKGTASLQDGTKGTYEVNTVQTEDREMGEITVTTDSGTYQISPAKNGESNFLREMTRYSEDAKENGTAYFSHMLSGKYYIREISAPVGYSLNTSEIMTLVTDNSTYINAGEAGDGVTVARGPGYLAANMQQFASIGDVDNTLSWIYTQLKISPKSASFADVNKNNYETSWRYISKDEAADLEKDTVGTDDAVKQERLTSFWEYDLKDALFNYKLNHDDINQSLKSQISTNVSAKRRLSTDIGWSYLEVYQNYPYGMVKKGSAGYDDWWKNGTNDISNLFSRSIYIRVTDKIVGDLEISKTVKNIPDSERETEKNRVFEFKVTLKDADGNAFPENSEYIYKVYNVKEDGKREPATKDGQEITGIIKGGSAGIDLTDGQIAVIEKLPEGTRYSITENITGDKEKIYSTMAAEKVLGEISDENQTYEPGRKTWIFKAGESRTVEGSLYWYADEKGITDNISAVDFTNTWPPDLTFVKVDSTDTTKKLPGAKFIFYYTVMEQEETAACYYSSNGWVFDKNQADTLTSDANGEIKLEKIPDGIYTLEEKEAPAGYARLTAPITIEVEKGKLKKAHVNGREMAIDEDKPLTLTVPNATSLELPHTGGPGSGQFVITGFGLICLAAGLLYIKHKKRGREGCDRP